MIQLATETANDPSDDPTRPTRLAVLGGSFNPPGMHHRAMAQRLAEVFDQVVVCPCGPRPDKPATNDVEPLHRAAMVDLTFQQMPGVEVDLFDLEANTFTTTAELERRYAPQGEVWHAVDRAFVERDGSGRSKVERDWFDGARLWAESRFAVLEESGPENGLSPFAPRGEDAGRLPPRCLIVPWRAAAAGKDLRGRVFQRQSISGLVTARVEDYVERYKLYRGASSPHRTHWRMPREARRMIVADDWNPKAVEWAEKLGASDDENPDLIVVIGGDGTMLRAIRSHWRLRRPFYGLNTGHLGFLLNDRPPEETADQDWTLHQVPLLWVETIDLAGERREALAFNDAWVERATGQTAWIEVKIDGHVQIERLIADGALVATAAGSASYARAMGATPAPLGTPALLLVGSNVLHPDRWRPVVLPLSTEVQLTTLDPEKRPLRGYVDGAAHNEIQSMTVRVSRIAAVELAFDPDQDPAAKLARIQFPK